MLQPNSTGSLFTQPNLAALSLILTSNKLYIHQFPLCREVLFHQEAKNESEDYIPAPWVPTFEVQTTASHTFTLREENVEEAVVRGCEFMVNPIEPIRFEVQGCPTLYTGR